MSAVQEAEQEQRQHQQQQAKFYPRGFVDVVYHPSRAGTYIFDRIRAWECLTMRYSKPIRFESHHFCSNEIPFRAAFGIGMWCHGRYGRVRFRYHSGALSFPFTMFVYMLLLGMGMGIEMKIGE